MIHAHVAVVHERVTSQTPRDHARVEDCHMPVNQTESEGVNSVDEE